MTGISHFPECGRSYWSFPQCTLISQRLLSAKPCHCLCGSFLASGCSGCKGSPKHWRLNVLGAASPAQMADKCPSCPTCKVGDGAEACGPPVAHLVTCLIMVSLLVTFPSLPHLLSLTSVEGITFHIRQLALQPLFQGFFLGEPKRRRH